MSSYSTRPQRRSNWFLTEKGEKNLDSLLEIFLTKKGIKNFKSLQLGKALVISMTIYFVCVGAVTLTTKSNSWSFSEESQGPTDAIGSEDGEPPVQQQKPQIPADEYSDKWAMMLPRLYITQELHGRNAVDLRAEVGTPLRAVKAGIVITSENSYDHQGKWIVIEHRGGVQSVYCHLSELYVTPGQVVKQGELIGLTGNTGNTTGPHLHFAVRGGENPLKNAPLGAYQ